MKKVNVKQIIIILLLTVSQAIPQSDSGLTYYPDNINMDYNMGNVVSKSIETGISVQLPNIISFTGINKVKFLNENHISISSKTDSSLKLNINNIKNISIRDGSYWAAGIGIGIVAGILTGALVGHLTEDQNAPRGWFYIDPAAVGGVLGIPIGALVGGIIGGSVNSYEYYDVDKFEFGKGEELKRILSIDELNNSSDRKIPKTGFWILELFNTVTIKAM